MNKLLTRIISLLLLLVVMPASAAVSKVITASFCEPVTYLFGCQELTATGIYHDTLTRVMPGDSIVELRLTVGHTDETHLAATIKEGESYIFGCKTISGLTPSAVPYVYKDTLPNVFGCDSVIILALTVNPACDTTRFAYSATITDGELYLFGCDTLKTAGVYTDTLVNHCGWDSIITLTLTVNPACDTTRYAYSATITDGELYLFGCDTLKTAGVYTDTLVNHCGWDSIITLTLTVNPACTPSETILYDTIYAGDIYLFGCRIFEAAHSGDTILTDTLQNYCGLDSVAKLYLNIIPVTPPTPCEGVIKFLEDTITLGQSYLFGCNIVTMTHPGDTSLTDDLTRHCGADSMVILNLHVLDTCAASAVTRNVAIRTGETFLFGCKTIGPLPVGGPYTYVDTLQNACGADSVITLKLSVYNACTIQEKTLYDTLMSGQDYLFGCTVYHFATPVDTALVDSLTTFIGGCDSVITMNLHVYDAYVDYTKTDTVCSGTTVAGHVITTDSIFNDTIQAVVPGTPDTINHWTVYLYDAPAPVSMHVIDSIGALPQAKKGCPIDVDVDALKNYVNTNPISGKMDTVTTIEWWYRTSPTASDDPVDDTKMPKTLDSIIVRYTMTTHCGATVYGGDTVLYLADYEYRESTDTAFVTVCDGDTCYWRGAKYTDAGLYYDTVAKTATPCDYDSVYVLKLTVQTATDMPVEDSVVCQADLPVLWREMTLTKTGLYHDTLRYAGTGCDSVRFTLSLIVDTVTVAEPETATICDGDSYTWVGHESLGLLTVDSTYYDTAYYHVSGCDSVYYQLTLTVQKAVTATPDTVVICDGDSYTWVGHESLGSLTVDSTYLDTAHWSVTGCDSVYYSLKLTVQKAVTATPEAAVICDGDSYIWVGHESLGSLTVDSTYLDTARWSVTGCDSVYYSLKLTVLTVTDVTPEDSVVCEGDLPVLWHGQTLTTDGIYYDTVKHVGYGCDSLRYTLNLTVLTVVDVPAVDTVVCENELPVLWHGQTLTTDGTYYDTIKHVGYSCDSLRYILNLTIHTVTMAPVQSDTICPDEYFIWRGDTLTEEGTYYDTLYWNSGCDSVIYQLDLTVWTVQKTDSLPAGAEFGMLVMVNRVDMRNDWNIDLTDDMADKVLWYRVVGAVDEWDDIQTHLDPFNNPTDQDVYLGSGFYYTDGRNILDGQYYAVIDWALPTDASDDCYHVWRTVVLTPQAPASAPMRLLPNRVSNGGTMLLTGIDWTAGVTTVRMLSASGQLMQTLELDGTVQAELTAEGVPGVYLLRVDNERQHETLKYIIVK